MLTPTHRVAKCAAVAAMKEYKNPHQASGAGDGGRGPSELANLSQ